MSSVAIRSFSDVRTDFINAAYARWWVSHAADLNDGSKWPDILSTTPSQEFEIAALCGELSSNMSAVAKGLDDYAFLHNITYTVKNPRGAPGGDIRVSVFPRAMTAASQAASYSCKD